MTEAAQKVASGLVLQEKVLFREKRGITEQEIAELKGIELLARFSRKIAKKGTPIDTRLICEAHKTSATFLHPEAAGAYRQSNARVEGGEIKLVPWEEIPGQMNDLVGELKVRLSTLSSRLEDIPKVISAMAYFHTRFIFIHPFPDGNGRTGRAITEMIAQRYGLYLPSWQPREAYFAAIGMVYQTQNLAFFEKFLIEGLIPRYFQMRQELAKFPETVTSVKLREVEVREATLKELLSKKEKEIYV